MLTTSTENLGKRADGRLGVHGDGAAVVVDVGAAAGGRFAHDYVISFESETLSEKCVTHAYPRPYCEQNLTNNPHAGQEISARASA
jgi:hypothetical protein